MSEQILIVGCGDIGRRVARIARKEGASVTGVVRSEQGRQALEKEGITPVVADLNDPEELKALPAEGKILFYFAPPPGGGITDPKVRNLCAAIPPGREPAKIIYISTSGVYGDCGGALVNEETPANPQTTRGRRRLDAEQTLLAWGEERGVPVVILRVTGIYGPGRIPLARIESGDPLLDEAQAPLSNRIHSEDLALVCLAAARKGEAGEIFNVSDGRPSSMTDYFNAVADAAGLPRPRQVSMEEAKKVMSPMMLSYLTESRRLDNTRMLTRLGVKLLHPDLAEGIRSSLAEQQRMIAEMQGKGKHDH